MREAARALMTRAELQIANGKPDAALASCATIIELAVDARSAPSLIGILTSSSVQTMGLDGAELVLSEVTPSPTACRALSQLLDDSGWRKAWVRALQGERADDLSFMEVLESGVFDSSTLGSATSVDAWRYNLYLTLGRPLWNGEKLANLELATARIEMISLPWPQATPKADQIAAEETLLPSWQTEFTRSEEPTTWRHLWSRDKGSARLRAAQIALALIAYHQERGSYPASLSDLAKDGWKLPLDPFTDQPYRYQQVGKGFMVYSLGPDLKDNGGTDYGHGRFKPDQPGYDFVFRVSR
jgi:hypothetical protein